MKKLNNKIFMIFALIINVAVYMTPIRAASSNSVAGIGYTVHGSINNTLLNASVTGTVASKVMLNVSGYVQRPNRVNYCGPKSGNPYVNYSYRAIYSDAVNWVSGYISSTVSGEAGVSYSLKN